mmetsp:Transcript_7181/g.23573  ORF Transcript_7181/g.23573 Transcript_7181/m.23573 type:complete len:113 (+) Transcript_7181:46-384(+)
MEAATDEVATTDDDEPLRSDVDDEEVVEYEMTDDESSEGSGAESDDDEHMLGREWRWRKSTFSNASEDGEKKPEVRTWSVATALAVASVVAVALFFLKPLAEQVFDEDVLAF